MEENSILEKFALRALAAYNLPPVRVTPLRFANNAVFRVDADAQISRDSSYILRVHRLGYRTPAYTRSELLYLQSVRKYSQVSVPVPIQTTTGDVLTILEWTNGKPTRYADLTTWLPGRERRPGSGLGQKAAYRLGESVAQIHLHSEQFEPPPDFSLPLWDADGLLTSTSPCCPGDLSVFLSPDQIHAFEYLHSEVQNLFILLGQSSGHFGVIHADLHLGNCLWEHSIPQILDFDDSGWGYYLYDIAPILGNFSDYSYGKALQQSFLQGYRNIRALSVDWEPYLSLLIATRYAAITLWLAARIQHDSLSEKEVQRGYEHIALRLQQIKRTYPALGALL